MTERNAVHTERCSACQERPSILSVRPDRAGWALSVLTERGRSVCWLRTSIDVLHVGAHAVLLEDPASGLHLVSDPSRGLTPDGAVLERDAFAGFAQDARTGGRDLHAVLAGLRSTARVSSRDLRLGPSAIEPQAVVAFAQALDRVRPVRTSIDPAPLRALAGDLVEGAHAGDGDRVHGTLLRLVGAGPGATPTGDDVVVGVLAGLRAFGASTSSAVEVLAATARPLLGRTTAASGHEVRAALAGRFSERVHQLVGSLADPAAAIRVVAAASGWGATSGIDLASGLHAAVSRGPAEQRGALHHDTVRRCA